MTLPLCSSRLRRWLLHHVHSAPSQPVPTCDITRSFSSSSSSTVSSSSFFRPVHGIQSQGRVLPIIQLKVDQSELNEAIRESGGLFNMTGGETDEAKQHQVFTSEGVASVNVDEAEVTANSPANSSNPPNPIIQCYTHRPHTSPACSTPSLSCFIFSPSSRCPSLLSLHS